MILIWRYTAEENVSFSTDFAHEREVRIILTLHYCIFYVGLL